MTEQAASAEVVETAVNGVPTFLVDGGGERITAGLIFRVGRVDEPLPLAGITHLIEHLALFERGLGEGHHNGTTTDTLTYFHVTGTSSEVRDHLNAVCRALRSLPLDRVEVEKGILQTEAAGRSRGIWERAASWRYGANGYGTSGYPELGLHRITGLDVSEWASTYFTAGNVTCWMNTATVPEGLDLTLPDGDLQPLPVAEEMVPQFPAHYRERQNAVGAQFIVERTSASLVFNQILQQRLFGSLRQDGGYSYTAVSNYMPRDATHALIVAMADCLPDKRDAATGAFIDVLASLRYAPVSATELESARARIASRDSDPNFATNRVVSAASGRLIGYEFRSAKQLAEGNAAVTAEAVQAVAQVAWATALFETPTAGLEWAGVTRAPVASEVTVSGTSWARIDDPDQRLIVAESGISAVHNAGGRATVLFPDLVALLMYPDGGRRLIGRDGFEVVIEPTLYPAEAGLEAIDRKIAELKKVPMPARHPDRIPKPKEVQPPPPPAPATVSAPGGVGVGHGRAARGIWRRRG